MKIWVVLFMLLLVACASDKKNTKWDELTLTVEVHEPGTAKFNFTCESNVTEGQYDKIFGTPQVDFPTKLKIDWGDGQTTDSDSHAYQAAGTYTVNIRGKGIGTFDVASESNLTVKKISAKSWPGLIYLNKWPIDVDFTRCPKVQSVFRYFDDPVSLDFSQCPGLVYLFIMGAVTDLNVTGCTEMRLLDCSETQLTQLDVSTCKKLKVLNCVGNQITQLDVSKNLDLVRLSIYSNRLTSLDVSKNPKLTRLSAYYNQLTDLDVSKNPKLTRLSVGWNRLTSLDISKNPSLIMLHCNNNQISTINASGHAKLEQLICSVNSVTDLDVSGCRKLWFIGCSDNQLTHSALNKIYNTLPYADGTIFIHDNPGTGDTSLAIRKGWEINPLE